jgi:hypothetical protein
MEFCLNITFRKNKQMTIIVILPHFPQFTLVTLLISTHYVATFHLKML